jgi:hypothetical protein
MMCHSERSEESSPSVSQLADPSQKMLRMTKRTQSCRRGSLNCFVKSTWVVIYHFHIMWSYFQFVMLSAAKHPLSERPD